MSRPVLLKVRPEAGREQLVRVEFDEGVAP